MTRPSPRSTLFPYTTLFRSYRLIRIGGLAVGSGGLVLLGLLFFAAGHPEALGMPGRKKQQAKQRSEEHTSELQSLRHLVCRLLLEKKKKKINNNHDYRYEMI